MSVIMFKPADFTQVSNNCVQIYLIPNFFFLFYCPVCIVVLTGTSSPITPQLRWTSPILFFFLILLLPFEYMII